VKPTRGERAFEVLNVTLMSLFAFVCLYPFVYIFALSFNDGLDSMRGGIWLFPRQFTLDNYARLFEDRRLVSSLLISIYRTAVGAPLGTLLNALFAFAISKRDLPGGKALGWMVVIPMYFGGGLIPYYLVCRALGLINSPLVFVIPWLATPFFILLLRVSMRELPDSLEESVMLDGGGYVTVFFRIVLPLTLPALATVSLLGGITHWNDWLDGTIMVTRSQLWPLQTLLLNIIQGSDMSSFFRGPGRAPTGAMARRITITPESLKMAMLVITVVPIFMIYPFAQRYFIRGMMVGSMKG
jgi:putative aldouronate transport system permease protein